MRAWPAGCALFPWGILMNQRSRDARQRLKDATREEFERIMYEALLTPSQDKIVRLHIVQDVSVCGIAERLCCSETTVRKRLSSAYEKVAKVRSF